MGSFIRKVIFFFLLTLLSVMVSILISFISKNDFNAVKDEKCSLVKSSEMGYHVSIIIGDVFKSSGALVGNRYVLTLAQEVFRTLKNDSFKKTVKVHVDTRTLPGGTVYVVEKITCPTSYDPSKISKDNIAVLRVNYIRAIYLDFFFHVIVYKIFYDEYYVIVTF